MKELQHLLNKLNKVTAYHRHGNKIPINALNELSNAQIEYEKAIQTQAGVMANKVLGQYCRDCRFENKSICDNPTNRQMLILDDDERFYIYPKFGCNKFESKLA